MTQPLVPGKHRFITTERLDKFISKLYWTDCNLVAVEDEINSKATKKVEILKWEVPHKEYYEDVPAGFGRSNPTIEVAKAAYKAGKFSPAKIGDSFGPLNHTFWFRVSMSLCDIKTPRKVDVRLQWNTESEGLVFDDENGAAIGGVTGEGRDFVPIWFDLDPISSSSSSSSQKTQEKVFWIEMVCSARSGDGSPTFISSPNPNRHFTLAKAEILLVDRDIRQFRTDIEILHALATTDGVADFLAEDALVTGNRALNNFQWNVPSTHLPAASVAASFFKKHSSLFKGEEDNRDVVACLGHCHIDQVWLWRSRETRRKIARSWASQLLLINQPNRANTPFTFVASQASQYYQLQQDYPELFERVKQEVTTKGRFFSMGATWTEMDGNLPSAESFIRQFVLGQNYFKEHFGKKSEIFWLPDTFGYSGQLPQISSHCGVKYFMSQKLSWNLINKPPHTSFYWKGIDGTGCSLLSHFPPTDNYCCLMTVEEVFVKSSRKEDNRDLARGNSVMLVYGHGDGGGGPTEDMLERLERFSTMTSNSMKIVGDMNPLQFFERLEKGDRAIPQLQTHCGELYFELHRGTFSVHRRFKHEIAKAEDMLRTTECVCSYAQVLSFASASASQDDLKYCYPTEKIWDCWQNVCLTQFHDSIPGSSITDCYTDGFAELKRALDILHELTNNALEFIMLATTLGKKNKKNNNRIVANMTSVDNNGNRKKISPYSIASIPQNSNDNNDSNNDAVTFTTTEQNNNSNKSIITIKNSEMTCVVESNGQISSFKLGSCEGVDHVISSSSSSWLQWTLFEDVPLFWDAWDIESYHLEKPITSYNNNSNNNATAAAAASASSSSSKERRNTSQITAENKNFYHVIEIISPSSAQQLKNGNVEVKTTLKLPGQVVIEQILTFQPNSANVVVSALVKNWGIAKDGGKHRVLKCLFPCNITNPNATYGTAFGAVQRPTHRNSSQDLARFEVCYDRWCDFSETGMGLTIANNSGMHGASVHESTMHLCILRAPTSPDPTADEGDHPILFVISPHNKSHYSECDAVSLAASLSPPFVFSSSNEEETAAATSSSASSNNETQEEEVIAKVNNCSKLHITAIKLPEKFTPSSSSSSSKKMDLIIRMYETVGGQVAAGKILSLFPTNENLQKKLSAVIVPCDGLEVPLVGEKALSPGSGELEFSLPSFKPFEIRTFRVTLAC